MSTETLNRYVDAGLFVDEESLSKLVKGLEKYYDRVAIDIKLNNGIEYKGKDLDFVICLKNGGAETIKDISVSVYLRSDNSFSGSDSSAGHIDISKESSPRTLYIRLSQGKKSIEELERFISNWTDSSSNHYAYLRWFRSKIYTTLSYILSFIGIFAFWILVLKAFNVDDKYNQHFWLIPGLAWVSFMPLLIYAPKRLFPKVHFHFGDQVRTIKRLDAVRLGLISTVATVFLVLIAKVTGWPLT